MNKSKELHPTVREFKNFINKHPKLRADIRRSGEPWQYYYEKWILNGENDPMWKSYAHTQQKQKGSNHVKQSEILGKLLDMTRDIDLNKVQKQVKQLDGTIGNVQEMLQQFLEYQNSQKQNTPPNRMHWFRD